MPRKTPARHRDLPEGRRFNEAAARCRGKRGAGRRRRHAWRRFNEAAARCRGKLRGGQRMGRKRELASMRPRPDAAENAARNDRPVAGGDASMRPRPDAAENFLWTHHTSAPSTCFNEAAARCRGKRSPAAADHEGRGNRFNEAAARCRGKLTLRNPLRFQVFTAAPRALPHSRQASETCRVPADHGRYHNCSVVKDLPVFEHSPGIPAALECSLRCGGTPQTMTGSRRTAWNFLPRLTTRGSAPSATPTSTSTTWSLA